MGDRHFYDANGNYRGSSSDVSPTQLLLGGVIFLVVLLTLAVSVIGALWNLLAEYKSYSLPYNIIAGYYYVIGLAGVAPIRGAQWLYSNITVPGLTQYKNLNLLISVVAGCVAGAAPYAAAYLAVTRHHLRRFVPVALVVPLLIAGTWALLKAVFLWLFA